MFQRFMMLGVWLLLALVVARAWCAEVKGAEASPARTQYMGREIARTMHYSGAPWLVRESREARAAGAVPGARTSVGLLVDSDVWQLSDYHAAAQGLSSPR